MTFQEFNRAIVRDDLLGKLLPLEIRRTYPYLNFEGTTLTASFVGYRIQCRQKAVLAMPPLYYLKITYPKCTMESFEKLPGGGDGHVMTPTDPAALKRLENLCDEVLELFERKSANIASTIEEYNALLKTVLEPEQLSILEKYLNQ